MSKPLKLAAVTTCYSERSHADVLVSRWLEPRPTDARWGWSAAHSTVVSVYTHKPEMSEFGREILDRHHVPVYDTIDAALTHGSDELAVDGVLLIGEHGKYPLNSFGQMLYPRKEMFDQIVATFRRTGRSVPVFCDKHYSWNFDWAREMVDTARSMGFLLIAGSSIPHCPRRPSPGPADGAHLEQATAVFFNDNEGYGFHSLDFLQAIVERRRGGEVGVESVTALQGEAVWDHFESGRWPMDLLDAAMTACASRKPGAYRDHVKTDEEKKIVRPAAFEVVYRDGLRATHVNMHGQIRDWAAAARVAGEPEPVVSVAMGGDASDFHGHFAGLARVIEQAMVTGRSPFAPERTLLTTGLTAAFMHALAQPGQPLMTPELHIPYQPAVLV